MIIPFGKHKDKEVYHVRVQDNSYYRWAIKNNIEPFITYEAICLKELSGTRSKVIAENAIHDPTDHYYADMMSGGCC